MLGLVLVIAGSGLADVTPPTQDVLSEGPQSHVIASGVTVEMPALGGLSCEEMRAVLARIDMSDYRGRGLLGEDHPDYPVFVYEDQLASALYFDCTLRATRVARDMAVFSGGFGRE